MKKNRIINTLGILLLSSTFVSCGARGTTGDVDPNNFLILTSGSLQAGGSAKFQVNYKSETLDNANIKYEVVEGADNVKEENGVFYFVNRETTSFTIKASLKYNEKDYTISRKYEVVNDDITFLKDIKTNGVKGKEYNVRGTVVYKKPNKSGFDGIVVADGTDTIYVYGPEVADSVNVGNKVKLSANFAQYIVKGEETAAEKWQFTGGLQLEYPKVLSNDGKTDNSFLSELIYDSSLADVENHPMYDNITSNLYRVKAKVHKVQEQGYFNYYFYDPNEVNSMYAYSNYNGAEYNWLAKFDDDKYHECVIMVVNAKCTMANTYYRMIPFAVDSKEYVQTNSDRVNGVMVRALDSFNKTFYTTGVKQSIPTLKEDKLYKDAKVTYTSSNQEIAKITDTGFDLLGKTGSVDITVNVEYKDTKKSVTTAIEVKAKPVVETRSIDDILTNPQIDEEVAIEGIVVDYSWLANSGTDRGVYYIQDSTGRTIMIQPNAQSIGTELEPGENVIFKGKLAVGKGDYIYFEENYKIVDGTLLFHDSAKNPLYKEIETKTIEELAALVPNDDPSMIGRIYKTTYKVKLDVQPYYSNYVIYSLDETVSFNAYSSNAKILSFLDQYVGKTVTGYIAIRDSKTGEQPRYDVLRSNIEVVE